MVFPVWPDVCLDILVVEDFSVSRIFSFGGTSWEVVKGFNKTLISVLNPLGDTNLINMQVLFLNCWCLDSILSRSQKASSLCLLQLLRNYKNTVKGSQEVARGSLLPPRNLFSAKPK